MTGQCTVQSLAIVSIHRAVNLSIRDLPPEFRPAPAAFEVAVRAGLEQKQTVAVGIAEIFVTQTNIPTRKQFGS
jgi:hypothetical protein